MATLRDIKRRIVGVKNTQQITKAMKMVAAAKLRRAQENIINARPYYRKISEVLQQLLSIEKNIENPLLENRETKNILIIAITSDRGLAGSFNMNIFRETQELITNEYKEYLAGNNIQILSIGKKASDYFNRRNIPVAGSYPGFFSYFNFSESSKIVSEIQNKYLSGEVDKVIVIYNEFKSIIQQRTVIEQILPIQFKATEASDKNDKTAPAVDYIYEPDQITIINSLLPKYLKTQLWRILLESYAAEQGARMTAMEMATENAKELISQLKLKYNKERQASITKEILEIVSGANALKGS